MYRVLIAVTAAFIFCAISPLNARAHPVEETDFSNENPVIYMDHLGYSPTDFDEVFVSPFVRVGFAGHIEDRPEAADWIKADFHFGCIEPDGTLRTLFMHEDVTIEKHEYFSIGFYGERVDMVGCDGQNDNPTEYAGFVKSYPTEVSVDGSIVSIEEVGVKTSIILVDTDLDVYQDDPPIGGGDARFLDVPLDHTFNADVEWLAAEGVTRGCDPPLNLHYCPDDPVTRGQMAAFLVRALGLPARGYDEYATFADVGSTHTFFDEVGILGAEGITRGCNPPDNSRFCPDDPVTRGQMAAFLVRALGLPPSSTDSFVDDDGSVFEKDIQALAASGITRGCNPPANSRFCPDEPVSRAQMAAFLHRALGQ